MNQPQVLFLDNFDSFTWILVRYLEELGATVTVRRNVVPLAELATLVFDRAVISPGPGHPKEAKVALELVEHCRERQIPLLGVCLGHQAIGLAYGWPVVRAERPMHGKASEIYHDGTGIFTGVSNPLRAGRYHSLIVKHGDSAVLTATAHSASGEIMALRHRQHPVVGVQFHPESWLTQPGEGMKILRNFLTGRI